MKSTKLLIILILFLCACDNSDIELSESFESEGYIVAYDPCTIRQQFRVGYIFISSDYNDTLVIYNLSDNNFKMPAKIGIRFKTLYSVPDYYFKNYMSTAYFPLENRYDFPIRLKYIKTPLDRIIVLFCVDDFNQSEFNYQFIHNQAIVLDASIPDI